MAKKASKKKTESRSTPPKKTPRKSPSTPNKTQPTASSVTAFLNAVEDPERRADCKKVARLMRAATGAKPKMWGPSIVGFGEYHYVYASGREGDWFLVGFSPRKNDLTLYLSSGFEGREDLLARLGKHKTGKACLYVKRLDDIDLDVLEEMIARSVEHTRATQKSC